MNDMLNILAVLLAAVPVVAGAYKYGKKRGASEERIRLDRDAKIQSLKQIYAPLFGLFITRHITYSSGRGAKYFRQRFANARRTLIDDRSPLMAVRALFDQQHTGISAEVEYGGDFPLREIQQQVRGREDLADRALLLAIASADRAEYERAYSRKHDGLLTDEQFQLFNHICTQHASLSASLGRDI